MKKPGTFKASNSLLGAILILSLSATVMLSSLEGLTSLYAAGKSQWHNFNESLSMMQPHRTVFP